MTGFRSEILKQQIDLKLNVLLQLQAVQGKFLLIKNSGNPQSTRETPIELGTVPLGHLQPDTGGPANATGISHRSNQHVQQSHYQEQLCLTGDVQNSIANLLGCAQILLQTQHSTQLPQIISSSVQTYHSLATSDEIIKAIAKVSDNLLQSIYHDENELRSTLMLLPQSQQQNHQHAQRRSSGHETSLLGNSSSLQQGRDLHHYESTASALLAGAAQQHSSQQQQEQGYSMTLAQGSGGGRRISKTGNHDYAHAALNHVIHPQQQMQQSQQELRGLSLLSSQANHHLLSLSTPFLVTNISNTTVPATTVSSLVSTNNINTCSSTTKSSITNSCSVPTGSGGTSSKNTGARNNQSSLKSKSMLKNHCDLIVQEREQAYVKTQQNTALTNQYINYSSEAQQNQEIEFERPPEQDRKRRFLCRRGTIRDVIKRRGGYSASHTNNGTDLDNNSTDPSTKSTLHYIPPTTATTTNQLNHEIDRETSLSSFRNTTKSVASRFAHGFTLDDASSVSLTTDPAAAVATISNKQNNNNNNHNCETHQHGLMSSSSPVKQDREIIPLGNEKDKKYLSEFLTFLRCECLEVFVATVDDVQERMISRKVKLGQVGIRCRFCAHLPAKMRACRSSAFPSSIAGLYQGVLMMNHQHFSDCESIPSEVKARYYLLKKMRKRGGADARVYWIESARQLGLVDSIESGEIRRGETHSLNHKF